MSTVTTPARAAIFWGAGRPQEIAEVVLGRLGPDQVIVEMRAVGICGSDLHMINGAWVRAQPMVLGHEGAGVVAAVGEQVIRVAVGDHVALCWAAPCGECASCAQGAPQRCLRVRAAITEGTMIDSATRIELDGEPVYRMTTTGAFAEAVLVTEAAAMPIPESLPFEQAALLGCAALTGTGAVFNAGDIDVTTDVVIVGAGGVGQFAIQAARIAGAPRIVAVDPSLSRRELAVELGAAAAIAPEELADQEPFARAVDAVGSPATTKAAVEAVAPGGRIVVVGLSKAGARLELDPTELVSREKTLTGSYYGSADPVASLRRLLDLVGDGSLVLEPLVGSRYPLERIEDAVAEANLAAGGRVILTPTGGAG
jgi:S-(hydroxymethyl)glutathione dehydrogenase / alcohol dehydrogenase